CFVSSKVADKLKIRVGYMEHTWTVQYGNNVVHRVNQCLFEAPLELPEFMTRLNLYVAPLGSYDVFI
ncbi:hypothetical protein KI387_026383, partial [Taxus chinensis]